MGKLFYGNSDQPIAIPDRLLAHLQVVASTKLRRSESFTLSWLHPDGEPEGRSTIWVHCSIPLRFVFDRAERNELDPALLRELAEAAYSPAGVIVDLTRDIQDTGTVGGRADVARAA